jgi:uncharacterized protein YbjT (DUF2867 family)
MKVGQDIILVTGATGQQGGATARELLAAGHKIRAMTRNPAGTAAKALVARGAELVQGDLNDEASVRRALAGVWGAFTVQNTWEAGVEGEEEQGKRFAHLAKAAGLQHLVYASVGSAHRATGVPHFDNKWRVEETIRSLGLPSWTILRAAFFMENLLSPWFKPAIDQGQLAVAIKPTTRLQMIAVADIGKYGRLAFEKHAELNGKALDIAGDELTMPEAAALITKVAGRPVTHFQPPISEVRKASEDFALMLEWFDRVGFNADIAGNAKAWGIPPTSFAGWAAKASWG